MLHNDMILKGEFSLKNVHKYFPALPEMGN